MRVQRLHALQRLAGIGHLAAVLAVVVTMVFGTVGTALVATVTSGPQQVMAEKATKTPNKRDATKSNKGTKKADRAADTAETGGRSASARRAKPTGRVAGEPGRSVEARAIPDRYIVVLRDDLVSISAADDLAQKLGLEVTDVYDVALKGFAAKVPAGRLRALKNDPRVASVEPDRVVRAFADELVTGVDRIGADRVAEGEVPNQAGAPVAVIDSGIAKHPDLNVKGGYNCLSSTRSAWGDGDGHGTHIAGTIGAKQNDAGVVGVAPGTPLWAVRVLDNNGSGSSSSVICGLNWVAKNAAAKGITVANLSLGVKDKGDSITKCSSSALHTAVCKLKNAGVRVVVAAGNDGADAANYVPAKYAQVTTVSALTDTDGCAGAAGPSYTAATSGKVYHDDTFALFSNWGTVVDVAAPGVNIESTWKGGGYNTISGTSMAAPHVAGAFALGWDGTTKEAGPIPGDDRDAKNEGIVSLSANTACD